VSSHAKRPQKLFAQICSLRSATDQKFTNRAADAPPKLECGARKGSIGLAPPFICPPEELLEKTMNDEIIKALHATKEHLAQDADLDLDFKLFA